MKKILLILLLLPFTFFTGCKDDDPDNNPPKDPFDQYDRKDMLRNLGYNVIIPVFNDFNQKTNALQQAVNNFTATPTATSLDALQNAWKEAAFSWKRAEMYKIGPLDKDNNGNNLIAVIDFGSANTMEIANAVNTAGVENAINSAPGNIDNAYIESLTAANLKGLPTIEYLLFNRDQGNSFILDQYINGANVQKRKDYLKALGENLKIKSETIVNAWSPSGGNHLETFINADGRDIGSSIGMMVNEIVYQIEVIRNEKVGRPLGKRTNGSPQPLSVEAKYSNNSIAFIKENITGLERAFKGEGTAGDKSGFDDLLNHLKAEFNGQPLAQLIKDQFGAVKQKADAVNMPLQDAISQNPAAVEALYTELNKLLVLTKVDMVNNIGVVITYIDNDGD
jgi:uncharacterized protein